MTKKIDTTIDKTIDPAQAHTNHIKLLAEMAKVAEKSDEFFDFSKIHLHIGLPCYGGMLTAPTMLSILGFTMLATQIGLRWSLDTMMNESLVQRARNSLTAKMLNNKDATHFMFIDADIEFDPESIVNMIVNDKDIISGAYPKKSYPIAYNINLEKQTKLQGTLYTVDTAATGFLMYKRKVIEDLIAAHPEWKYKDDIGLGPDFADTLYAIFDCYIDANGHYLSEDWAFCRRVKEMGYEIWCDSSISLNHIGSHTFRGDTKKLEIKAK